MRVRVGCCGFPMSRRRYYEMFDTVELQETFYNKPDPERMRKLRDEAPEGFVFNMKAWQAITHPPNSPTWRKSKWRPPKDLWDRYGDLKPTRENMEAWETVCEAAEALAARVIVVQTPPRFGFSEENVSRAIAFFREASSICRARILIGWEPRGSWRERPNAVATVIESIDNLIHVVDPFRWWPPVSRAAGTAYLRLHGIGGRETNYRYRYTDEDLARLREMVAEVGGEEVFVMFNNVFMKDDASRFKGMLEAQ